MDQHCLQPKSTEFPQCITKLCQYGCLMQGSLPSVLLTIIYLVLTVGMPSRCWPALLISAKYMIQATSGSAQSNWPMLTTAYDSCTRFVYHFVLRILSLNADAFQGQTVLDGGCLWSQGAEA